MRIMVFMNCNRLKGTPSADCCHTETLPSRPRTLRRYHWTLCALARDRIAASAQAAMTKIKFQPNSADINDLDHRLVHGVSSSRDTQYTPMPGLAGAPTVETAAPR